MGKPEPEKKARITLATDQDFLAWTYPMLEKRVFANEGTPYIELQSS